MTVPIATSYIMPAEYIGAGHRDEDGLVDIAGVKIWTNWAPDVYVRRVSTDLQVIEIVMARHDGLSQEELDEQNRQAQIYPLGPKEYWRSKRVPGEMSNDEFEAGWGEYDDLPFGDETDGHEDCAGGLDEVFRAKGLMDGAETFAEIAAHLRGAATYVDGLAAQGFELTGPVEDDYAFYARV